MLVNPNDYFLYLPLLPEVAAGVLEPRRVSVSLAGTLPGVRLVLGEVRRRRPRRAQRALHRPRGRDRELAYDRLVLTVGSVNKLLPVPGVAEHAHGFRGMPEALYLRDHITRQIELAAATATTPRSGAPAAPSSWSAPATPARRWPRTASCSPTRWSGSTAAAHDGLPGDCRPRWLLLDIADRVLPELDERLSTTADRVLRRRGVEVRTGTSVQGGHAARECCSTTASSSARTR